jgi:DNA replication protein DnaC
VRELRALRSIREASNAIFVEPPGLRKTHLSVALAKAAIQAGSALTSSPPTTWFRI